MEDKALEILRTMFERRKMNTVTTRVELEDVDRVSAHTIGNVLVIFSQKDKGVSDRDIVNFLKVAEAGGYGNGIVIVSMSKPSENVLKTIKSHAKDRVQFFWIWELQFDITTHRLYQPHRILNEEEKAAVLKKYNAKQDQLMSIDSQDPPIKWIGAVPGDIVEVLRPSDVTGVRVVYRNCVEDTNVA
jgi:DNA-directed RNA polymerase subunit H (RpoH/RPB5)